MQESAAASRDGAPAGIAVGELARRTGITTAAINYYVNRGLLPRPVKTGRTRALYNPRCVELIARIRALQGRGLTLALIARVLASANPAEELGLAAPSRRSRGEALSEDEFLAETGLDHATLADLLRADLIRSSNRHTNRRGEGRRRPLFDRADVAAGRAFARLLACGVGMDVLLRHSEYQPVARAEAHFMAEHLALAMRRDPSPRVAAATRAAFGTLRDYMRLREMESAYPDWRHGP